MLCTDAVKHHRYDAVSRELRATIRNDDSGSGKSGAMLRIGVVATLTLAIASGALISPAAAEATRGEGTRADAESVNSGGLVVVDGKYFYPSEVRQ